MTIGENTDNRIMSGVKRKPIVYRSFLFALRFIEALL